MQQIPLMNVFNLQRWLGGDGLRPGYYPGILGWYAWPAWPLAAWALYRGRRQWRTPGIVLPVAALAGLLGLYAFDVGPGEERGLILLLPLALLGANGLFTLRRGAANALLWFALMLFGFLALVLWVYWSAHDLGTPGAAGGAAEPAGLTGVGELRPWALALGLVVTLSWIVFLARVGRSPLRPVLVWTASMTFIWALLMALFQAPLDRRLSYASVAEELAARVPAGDCIQTAQMRSQQRLLLAYHSGRQLVPADVGCNWLLVETRRREAAPHIPADWVKQWEGARPGDRGPTASTCMAAAKGPGRARVAAVVLAGGEGRRMGGADKGLLAYQGYPLIEWVLTAVTPQVDEVVISANRNLDRYAGMATACCPTPCPATRARWRACWRRSTRSRPTGCWWCRATRRIFPPTWCCACWARRSSKACRWRWRPTARACTTPASSCAPTSATTSLHSWRAASARCATGRPGWRRRRSASMPPASPISIARAICRTTERRGRGADAAPRAGSTAQGAPSRAWHGPPFQTGGEDAMKTPFPSLFLAAWMALGAAPAAAAETAAPWGRAALKETAYAPQKAVYDVAVSTPAQLEGVIDRVSYLNNLYLANPFDASIVVVLHGDEIPLFGIRNFRKNRELMERARSLTQAGPIEFRMCVVAARARGYQPEDIHGFVRMVPMADAEIVRLQREGGYAYMR
jgi:intracellular sulfur oxidation DsrE/DsrF family protein